MYPQIQLKIMANGRELPYSKRLDPFDLRLFPGVINDLTPRVLEKLGRDISVVIREKAKMEAAIDEVNVKFDIKGNKLLIEINQRFKFSERALALYRLETGKSIAETYPIKATLAVLYGKSQNTSKKDIAYDFVAAWRNRRSAPAWKPLAYSSVISPFFGSTMGGFGTALLS